MIREVTPFEVNKQAIGLDISTLNYRNDDWLSTRNDSLTNVTHWLELVQGGYVFLIDAPLFYNGEFHGTITAGMDFKNQFDEIMLGGNAYRVEVRDERGTLFYEFGNGEGTEAFAGFTFETEIPIQPKTNSYWSFKLVPNRHFTTETAYLNEKINLVLGVILSISLAVALYFMLKSRQSQKSYMHANRKLRALIDSAPMAIYVINPDGVIVDFWNKAAEDMLGWTKEEVLGSFMPHVGDEYEEDFKRLMQATLKGEQIKEKELVRLRKDGSKIHVRLNVGQLVNAEGKGKQMLVLLEDITEQKETQQKLEKSLEEKEVLLMEVHHRVKNNLAIITGLLELQASEVESDHLKGVLRETQNRIYTIAGVHELLYKTASFSDIGFETYTKKLVTRISNLFKSEEQDITIHQDLGVNNLNMNQAIPLGLMLNELVTNSFKHAFKQRKAGEIWISMKRNGNDIEVTYRDNGTGFDEKEFKESNSLGLTLIKTLLHQLYSEYTIDLGEGFRLQFHFEAKTKGSHSNL